MTTAENYRALLRDSGFEEDAAQRHAVARLDDLRARLLAPDPRRSGWPQTAGIYFWGGVGRGKTMLMDLFFQALPAAVPAERVHFHAFMNRVHEALKQRRKQENPLAAVAAEVAARSRLLCLDEFVIIDIGDAMIMAGLLQTLFAEGVVLVTTSNVPPADLYRDGLQRARFLPAIALLERHCEIVNLDGGADYRLRFLRQTSLYTVPHDAAAEAAIRAWLAQRVEPGPVEQQRLLVNGRELKPRYCAEDTVWFDFAELCATARSQHDYLELARCFGTVIVTGIRRLGRDDEDIARRFVLLIDVLYDHRVKLIASAEVTPERIYRGERLAFEFERTASRLIEMQSSAYLGEAHTQQ